MAKRKPKKPTLQEIHELVEQATTQLYETAKEADRQLCRALYLIERELEKGKEK